LEIVVRVSGPDVDTEARLVNLAEFDAEKDPENAMSYLNKEVKSNDPNTWGVGDTIQFEITVGGADFREPPAGGNPDADGLTVLIIHTPSNAVIVEKTFRS